MSVWSIEEKIREYKEIFKVCGRRDLPNKIVLELKALRDAIVDIGVRVDFLGMEEDVKEMIILQKDLDEIISYIRNNRNKINKLSDYFEYFRESLSGVFFRNIDEVLMKVDELREKAKEDIRMKGVRGARCIKLNEGATLYIETDNPTDVQIKFDGIGGVKCIKTMVPFSLKPRERKLIEVPVDVMGEDVLSLRIYYKFLEDTIEVPLEVTVDRVKSVRLIEYLNVPVRSLTEPDLKPNLRRISGGSLEIGGWRIRGFIGEGGFYYTFLAQKEDLLGALRVPKEMIDLRDLRTRRDVDQDAFYRMKREAEIIKKVQKIREYGIEHIIKLYEDGTEAQYELPYLVVEYCERGSLLGVCGKMSEREILIVLYQIAYTLKRCYEEGIFQKHGDIKPENILIDSQGRPVISDFHTARRRGRVSSFEESRTLGYFIDFPDDRADVYALGRLAIDLAKGIEGKRSDLTTSPLYYLIQRAYPGEERLSGGIPNIDEFLDEIEKIFNIYYC